MRSKCFIPFLVLMSGSALAWSSQIKNIVDTKSIHSMDGFTTAMLETIAIGAQLAMDSCRNVFKWSKWNCPETTFSRRSKQHLTRETAYTRALLAAGIVHAVTKNCSRGEIEECSCNPTYHQLDNVTITNKMKQNKNSWSWGGCSDEPSKASEISKRFLDNFEKGTDAQAFVGMHNNDVGREVVIKYMEKKCRCHGVSGSCSLKICWMQLAPFPKIATLLKRKYRKAVPITYEPTGLSFPIGNAVRYDELMQHKIPKDTLIYLERSPNYCDLNLTSKWPGTLGRKCSKKAPPSSSPAERNSCNKICRQCGHRVRKQTRQIAVKCKCNFVWCCKVQCQTCYETIEEHFCY